MNDHELTELIRAFQFRWPKWVWRDLDGLEQGVFNKIFKTLRYDDVIAAADAYLVESVAKEDHPHFQVIRARALRNREVPPYVPPDYSGSVSMAEYAVSLGLPPDATLQDRIKAALAVESRRVGH